jgi:hypothetical protein
LMRHPGRTFTRDELMARAFGPDYDGLDRTIDTHITNLRRKLEPSAADRSGASGAPSRHAVRERARDRDTRDRETRDDGTGQRGIIVTVHGMGYKLAAGEEDR